jgi:hypothetical protein
MKTMKTMKTILLAFALVATSLTAFAQVGIGTTMPDASGALDIKSTTSGLLPPRMTTAERDLINSGVWAEGLTIYNSTNKCLETWNGTDWISVCDGSVVTTIPPVTIPDNATCAAATISATPCTTGELASGINGGSLGNKYNNDAGGTYSVVEIGGQCWMQENIDVDPTGSPAHDSSTDTSS